MVGTLKSALPKIVDIIVSIISLFAVPVIFHYVLDLSWFENILTGVLVFLIWRIVVIYHENSEIKRVLLEGNASIEKLHSITVNRKIPNDNLADIAALYNKLNESGKYTFFVKWYKSDIAKLKENLENTQQQEYVKFAAYKLQDEAHPIYQVFDGKNNDSWCAPCTCEGIHWWLNPYGKSFVDFIQKNVKNKKIKSVRRVFIYRSEDELRHPLVLLCFALHKNEVYNFRVISQDDYDDIFKEKNTDGSYSKDFGLYGKEFVWETTKGYDEHEVILGNFSMNKNRVKVYRDIFESLWKKAVDYSAEKIPFPEKSLADLPDLCKPYKVENKFSYFLGD